MQSKLYARRLVQLELMNHMTPAEMAGIAGVSSATYYRYRAGDIAPDYDVLKRMVDKFKIDAGWLFNEGIT